MSETSPSQKHLDFSPPLDSGTRDTSSSLHKGGCGNDGAGQTSTGWSSDSIEQAKQQRPGSSALLSRDDSYASNRNGVEPLPIPFCLLTCGTKPIFVVSMFLVTLLFLIVPIVSAIDLHDLYQYNNVNLPNYLYYYFGWTYTLAGLNSIGDVLRVFTYYGAFTPSFTTATESSTDVYSPTGSSSEASFLVSSKQALSMTNMYIRGITNAVGTLSGLGLGDEMQTAELQMLLSTFQESTVLSYAQKVIEEQALLISASDVRSLRDIIINNAYGPTQSAIMARPSNLMSLAKLSCFNLDLCWTGDGKAYLDQIEVAAGKVVAAATNVVLDVFAVIEYPNLNASTLQELVENNLLRTTARTKVLNSTQDYYTELVDLLKSITQKTFTDAGSETIFFVTPNGWATGLLSSVQLALDVADNVTNEYNTNSPVDSWLQTGAANVLQTDKQHDEIIAATSTLYSYFAYNIGLDLVLNTSDVTNEEIEQLYWTVPLTSQLGEISSSVTVQQSQSYIIANSFVSESLTVIFNVSLKQVITSLVVSVLVSIGLYITLMVVLRYRIEESVLPFRGAVAALSLMMAVQVGMSLLIAITSIQSAHMHRQVTPELMVKISDELFHAVEASTITSNILSVALLIAPGEEEAMSTYLGSLDNYTRLKEHIVGYDWAPLLDQFVLLSLDMYRNGFYPMRQQMSASSTLGLTILSLDDVLNLSSIAEIFLTNEDFKSSDEGCIALLSASTFSALTTNYINLVAVAEVLSYGTVNVKQVPTTDATSASLRASCLAGMVSAVTDPTKAMCMIPSICGQPASTYGMLRPTSSTSGLYNIFNPTANNFLGDFLQTWDQLANNYYMSHIQERFNDLLAAADADGTMVSSTRREVIWYGVFTCIFLELMGLALYTILFGPIFSIH